MAVDVGESELHRLDLQVQACCGIHDHAAQIEMSQNAQRDQRRDPLAIGWNLMNAMSAIILADRFDPVGLMRGKIVGFERRTAGGAEIRNALRKRTTIERLAAGTSDVT